MKRYDIFDWLVAVGVCVLFPVMIPVALGIVGFLAIFAAFSADKEHE